jgi:hypothetical protein
MGTYATDVAITAGSGTSISTWTNTAGDHVQVVRENSATATTTNTWTIATTASTSQVAADTSRVGVWMVNLGAGRVYLRFDSTAPTATAHHWYLDVGDRYELPYWATELAVSMLGASVGGTLVSCLATAA